MEQQKIDRINELARKSKTVGLTAEELAEQQTLRQEYLDAFRASFRGTLSHTVIERPDGTREPLTRRAEETDK